MAIWIPWIAEAVTSGLRIHTSSWRRVRPGSVRHTVLAFRIGSMLGSFRPKISLESTLHGAHGSGYWQGWRAAHKSFVAVSCSSVSHKRLIGEVSVCLLFPECHTNALFPQYQTECLTEWSFWLVDSCQTIDLEKVKTCFIIMCRCHQYTQKECQDCWLWQVYWTKTAIQLERFGRWLYKHLGSCYFKCVCHNSLNWTSIPWASLWWGLQIVIHWNRWVATGGMREQHAFCWHASNCPANHFKNMSQRMQPPA